MESDLAIFFLLAIGISYFIYRVLNAKGASFWGEDAPGNTFHQSKLVTVLLGLKDESVDELMDLYRKEFGKGPARYAKRTFQKWRSGTVQPATQTYERFLVHLPSVMSYDLKCTVLRHFMEEYAAKEHVELELFTDEWEEKLEPLVRQIVNRAFTAELPAEVEKQLKWLGEGDMQAAKEILKRSQAEEGRIMVSMLHQEFDAIEKILSEEHLKPRVTHVLKFPYGTITLYVRKRV